MREKVPSAKAVADTVNLEKRWVSVAFTWNGLRALGADEASLATFPEEFRQGMAARWQVIGDTGTNHPDNWIGGLAGPQLHAIAILFARDAATREQSVREHRAFLARTPGVEVLLSLDLEGSRCSSTYENILATVTGSRRRRLKERGLRRRPALDRRSRPANSSSGTPMKKVPPRICRSRKFFLATAATWRIVGYSSMWRHSATFCASKVGRLPKSRNYLPQN